MDHELYSSDGIHLFLYEVTKGKFKLNSYVNIEYSWEISVIFGMKLLGVCVHNCFCE